MILRNVARNLTLRPSAACRVPSVSVLKSSLQERRFLGHSAEKKPDDQPTSGSVNFISNLTPNIGSQSNTNPLPESTSSPSISTSDTIESLETPSDAHRLFYRDPIIFTYAHTNPYESLPFKIVPASVLFRDACHCKLCITPSSGQKTFATYQISPEIRPKRIHVEADGSLKIWWKNDISDKKWQGHVSEYPVLWMKKVGFKTADGRSQTRGNWKVPGLPVKMTLWNREMIESLLDRVPYKDFMQSEDALEQVLLDLKSLGLVFLTDVPKDKESVEKIGLRISNLQETFYGRTWDVVSKPQAENIAYTNESLGFHMDMLYLQSPPRIQILHCLENSATGGESLFSDAKYVAKGLVLNARRGNLQAKRDVEALASRQVRYHYNRHSFNYRNSWPVFDFPLSENMEEVWTRDALSIPEVYWSPPFQAPEAPHEIWEGTGTIADKKKILAWLTAIKKFRKRLENEENVFRTRLEPGTAVLFDNRRIVHARKAFDVNSGQRWLRGVYISDEDFRSRLENIDRETARYYSKKMEVPMWNKHPSDDNGYTLWQYLSNKLDMEETRLELKRLGLAGLENMMVVRDSLQDRMEKEEKAKLLREEIQRARQEGREPVVLTGLGDGVEAEVEGSTQKESN